MSVAWPSKAPLGWWIMIRVLGSAKRMPLVPPARMGTAIDAASPIQVDGAIYSNSYSNSFFQHR